MLNKKQFIIGLIIFSFLFLVKGNVFASTTDGTIDAANKYVWGENIGWVNFGTANGNVHITDAGLSGYALSETAGWINLANVTNDGEGNLSGYGWGENIGWINFNPANGGVVINALGEFTGSALGENTGWLIFDCATSACVKTDWRPASSRAAPAQEPPPPRGGSSASVAIQKEAEKKNLVSQFQEQIEELASKARELLGKIAGLAKPLVPDFLKPEPSEETAGLPNLPPAEEVVSQEAPLSMKGEWSLLGSEPIESFVLSPLPKEIRDLAGKFPELGKTFERIGITKITDLRKMMTTQLTLQGLTKTLGLSASKVEPGKFALPKGVPVSEMSFEEKQKIPTEIVFAKTAGRLIDYNIVLSITEEGRPEQRINVVSGTPLYLTVKPEGKASSVKGYLVFKSKATAAGAGESGIKIQDLAASLVFAGPVFARVQEKPIRTEEELVLLEFDYEDQDNDGIWTAQIQSPVVEGQYEIISVIEYLDPEQGRRAIRLTAVVDPEGYVYRKEGQEEVRVMGAVVSLFWLNKETKEYQPWPAQEYQQENPQITDRTGKYSFLVPEGIYHLKVEAPGYLVYEGEPFEVKEGKGIHQNIELKKKYWWLGLIDFKTAGLAAVLFLIVVLLIYNFHRDKIRERGKNN